jgi:NAD(P)-dependent dehydrogenase (short-subunit alcohol dehydrogenase family)
MAITLTYPQGCALVAGGTGRVGEGVVRRMAEAGVPTVFTYLSSAETAQAIEADLRQGGWQVWARQMDMGDNASIDAAVAFAEATAGPLHSVLCPAGAPVIFNRIADFTPEEVERFVLDDALTFYRLVNRTTPVLRANGGGRFVLCSTMALRRVLQFDGISPLSKGLVEALIRQIAVEEAPSGIRCNGVAIGWVVHETMEQVEAMLPPDPGDNTRDANGMLFNLLNRVAAWPRIRRPATLAEAGDLFAFLASDQAAYITGQVIVLDGGATL